MAYIIKRSIAKTQDYLHAWCPAWGTACMGSPALALTFETKGEAEAAAVKAQASCKGADGLPSPHVTFTPVLR